MLKNFVALIFACLLTGPAIAQTGIAGIQQRASASPIIYETFDRADGTTFPTAPGTTAAASGNTTLYDLAGGSVVENGMLSYTGNSYFSFHNSSTIGGTDTPLTNFGGSFRQLGNTGTGQCLTLIADTSDSSSLATMFHLNFGSAYWALTYRISGGAFVTMASGVYAVPLTPVGDYAVSMWFNYSTNTISFMLPDGTVHSVTNSVVGGSITPTIARYQLGAECGLGADVWTSIWSGQNKSFLFAANGNAAPLAETQLLKLMLDGKPGQISVSCPTGSTCPTTPFATFITPGAQNISRLTIRTVATDISSSEPGVAEDIEDWELPVFSTICCNSIGSMVNTHSNIYYDPTRGIYVGGSVTASISGSSGSPYTVTLFYTPIIEGPNQANATGVRMNYRITAEGDNGGIVQ